MTSLPTPESSPVGQSGANKLKDAEAERKLSKKERKEKKRLSKSSPGTSKNEKRKSLFPKVALPLFPKTRKGTLSDDNKLSSRRKSTTQIKKSPVKDPDFTLDSLTTSSSENEESFEWNRKRKSGSAKKVSELKTPKTANSSKTSKSPKTAKSPKTSKTLKSPKALKTPNKKNAATPNGLLENNKEKDKLPAKKIKLNGESTEELEVKKEEIIKSEEKIESKANIELQAKIELEAKIESQAKIESKVKIEWKLGTNWVLGKLAWARVGNFPFWPCVVTLDPETMLYHKILRTGNTTRNTVHVQYFGDNERHSWVSEVNIMCFTGPDDFEKHGPEFLKMCASRKRKKELKDLKAAFTVNASIKPKWEIAVSEATEILEISDEDRACMFAPAPSVVKIPSSPSKKKKRKLSLSDSQSEVPVKKSKPNVVSNVKVQTSKVQSSKDDSKSRKRINKSSKSTGSLNKSNLNPSKKNSKLNKSTGDLSKIGGKFGKLNGKFSKSTGNLTKLNGNFSKSHDHLNKIFEKTPKVNGKLSKDNDKSHKVNGKLHKSLKSCKVEIYYNLSQTPPTPPSSLLSNSWDEERKNSTFDIDYDSKLLALCDPELEDEIKKERLSDSIQENGEDSSNRSTSSDADEDSDSELVNKFTKKGKTKRGKEISRRKNSKEFSKGSKPMNLFKGIKQERVCQICEETGKLVRCKGPCFSYYHLSCVKPGDSSSEHSEVEENLEDEVFQDLKEIRKKIAETESFTEKLEVKVEEPPEEETFKCIDCLSSVAPACFICNDREIDRIRCSATACGRYYHSACLKTWPQSHWQGGRLTCPYHMCHTCNSDNPQNGHMGKTNEKLARCVRCPSSYHASSSCLPAGSEILTGSQIICPKHYKSTQPPLNATWCFLCTKGGSLICCDTCPTSFHPECLGIKAPDGAFICEDCETGRLPLYGEIVWVKLGSYRWWPSKICFPNEVPLNVEALNHKIGEFCVMFLGTRNYYWVHKGRAFLYQEGDACTKPSGKKNTMDEAFKKALKEANEFHQILKKQRADAKDQERTMKPPSYVKLKVNKPVGNVKAVEVESIVACICSAKLDNPCAPDTDCLNRMLCVECSPDICPAGSKCQNQCFVQRLYPAMEPFHTDGRGWGLRSLESIKSGQFVIEYVGEVIDEAEYKRRLQRKKELKNENYYFLTIDTGRMIDAEPKGNLSRFMNHSCQPNCETQKWTVNGDTRIGLFALKDIESGEELTFNYNLSCDGEKRKPCLCGAPNCSGFIGLKAQKLQISAIQDRKVEKTEKPKRQRRPKKLICWGCQKEITGEDPIKCQQKSCSKKYHKLCVTLKDTDIKFICPWHNCVECGRKTATHCSICKIGFCQVHQPKNLLEAKGTFVCKRHQNGLTLPDLPVGVVKDKIENLNPDLEKRSFSPFGSSSPILSRKTLLRNQDQSSRVSIVEVQLSSEETDECLTEDTDDPEEPGKFTKETSLRRSSRRINRRLDALKTLNSEQLLAIIGGGV